MQIQKKLVVNASQLQVWAHASSVDLALSSLRHSALSSSADKQFLEAAHSPQVLRNQTRHVCMKTDQDVVF